MPVVRKSIFLITVTLRRARARLATLESSSLKQLVTFVLATVLSTALTYVPGLAFSYHAPSSYLGLALPRIFGAGGSRLQATRRQSGTGRACKTLAGPFRKQRCEHYGAPA